MRRSLPYILIVILLGVALFFLSRVKKERHRDANSSVEQMTIPVTVSPVVWHEFRDEISAVGTLKARETCPLSPKVPGNVDAVLVDIGDRVKAGQVVIRLDRTSFKLAVNQARAAYAGAVAAVAQARARLEQAEKGYRRASNLLAEKVIPQSRFEAAEAAYKTSREALAAAKEQRNQATAALETAKEHLKDANIRSPIGGVVVERDVEVGQSVAPGDQVLRIVDQSSLKADVDLPERDFGRITIGIRAAITVDAFPGQEFPGKVTLVNPMVKRETRTFRVRIEVPNQNGKLVDGMFARARLLVGERTALAIPRDALQRLPGSGTSYVFVVNGNKAIKRAIKTGVIGDQYAEVLDGLTGGEKVVTSGKGRLRSGTEVMVSEAVKSNGVMSDEEETR